MDANTARIEQIAASTAPRLCAPDDERDRVIDTIARLLSSGQPLPEILQNIRKSAEGNDTTHPGGAAEAGTQIIHVPGEFRDIRPNSETIQPPEPVDVTLAQEEVQDFNDALDPNASAVDALDLGTSDGHESPQAAPVRQTWHIKLSGFIRAALPLVIPAVSLLVVVIAGKFLIDSNVVPNAAAAMVRAITQTVQSAKSEPILLGTEPDKKAASITKAAPAEPETVQPDQTEPQTAQPDRAEPQTGQLGRRERQLTPPQIRALLDRGDALVSRADMEAARPFFEQAAVAGNAEAAIRLGATYDPAFLAQARLRNVRGDATMAQYWYQRAHDLEQNPARLSSSEARN